MSNLKRIREALQMTQAELGAAIGVTQGSVSFYELGKHPVPPDIAAKVIAVARKKNQRVTFDDIYLERPLRGGRAHAGTSA